MKFWLPTLAIVATMAMPAFAQEAPPPDAMHAPGDAAMARPSAQRMAAMEKFHEQLQAIRSSARLQMLGSLSPAHRAAVANIIGQLAIAPNPNPRAAETQIDELLTAGEKTSVLNAEATARTNSRALMQTARTQMEAGLSADERAKMQARDAERASRESQNRRPDGDARTPDAGRTLLRVSAMGFGGGPGSGGPMGWGRRGEFMRGPGPGAPN